ncbi:MAG: bifunctional [glutamine synthetase] adenylyltransferase/[glutamine synthetase]-adenylyl-L-tyrosine phosphorylase [Rhodospirillales bacterium]|nr:bifunctional [glutamine synthetase] adenylyltransferase/[glutamine synthetase]-adenylyl-L-tyrosine phosphorylase [Rhodospirillales bacterium]
MARWRDAVAALEDADTRGTAERLADAEPSRTLLAAVFGNSPFLTGVMTKEPDFTVALLRDGPEPARASVLADVAGARRMAIDGADPSRALRIAKRRMALTAALADIADAWPVETVTSALSDLAEAALGCAAAYLLAQAADRGVLSLPDRDDPERGTGLIVIGMGKLGARELNYSSDIDIIVFYDPERIDTPQPDELQHQFVRLTRGLVKLIDHHTADGYVFRTDLRLRPDPGSTPMAISVLAAEAYYETLGQNWERAAMIKARPVAGDREAGEALLQRLVPFVWRRNLDFAAIQDIHSIKRQIIAHRGGGRVALPGHNIKLGRGGIREIEFFAQTQQLIWGGRLPEMRGRGTIEALTALAAAGKIAAGTTDQMIAAYRFLRRLEHRLQMINDEQTHALPVTPEGRAALAAFSGYPDRETFEADVLRQLRTVESHYAELFEEAPALSFSGGGGGNLVFTGADPDPETLSTIEALGFENPRGVDAAIRGWHHGRCRAMRSTRARELLTELMPVLLKSLAETANPNAAFLAFDKFLRALPAGIQLFSMFHTRPQLLQLVAELLGGAPRLAEALGRRPSLLEGVLVRDFFAPPPPRHELAADLEAVLARTSGLEEALNESRRWANDRRFQIGVLSLRGNLEAEGTATALSDVAEVALQGLHPRVRADFAARHGRLADCGMAVIAMGKLGGREMTATSDLDLIFVYDQPPDGAQTDGARPLSASQYFARLSQRLINAITAPTAEGVLYEVDMRLRPSGKAGPIAVSFESFQSYQRADAWTWERMALTRARVVDGPPELAGKVENVIRDVLTLPCDPCSLVVDVADMRARMEAEHRAQSIWEVKHVRGGLVDIEFLAQYLQLRHAAAHPDILSPNTAQALRSCGKADVLTKSAADDLLGALAVWQAVQNRIRLSWDGAVTARGADDVPRALRQTLDGLLGLSFDGLVERMTTAAAMVRERFAELIERPAAEMRSRMARSERPQDLEDAP